MEKEGNLLGEAGIITQVCFPGPATEHQGVVSAKLQLGPARLFPGTELNMPAEKTNNLLGICLAGSRFVFFALSLRCGD